MGCELQANAIQDPGHRDSHTSELETFVAHRRALWLSVPFQPRALTWHQGGRGAYPPRIPNRIGMPHLLTEQEHFIHRAACPCKAKYN